MLALKWLAKSWHWITAPTQTLAVSQSLQEDCEENARHDWENGARNRFLCLGEIVKFLLKYFTASGVHAQTSAI